MERFATLHGNSLALKGPQLNVGDTAPTARLRKDLLSDYDLNDAAGSPRVYSVVPSVDTPVCALQTKRFYQEAEKLEGVKFFTISCDLPTATGRFCGAEAIDNERIQCLSDHKYVEFGSRYGVLLSDLRILCRAAFVIDASDKIRYAEYVPEISDHPDYDAVIACATQLNN